MAVTDALAFSVNVQLFVLFPPLEQAPDQTTSRPFASLRVIDAPVGNVPDPLLPTVTLMPVGVDVIRSPLRPLAVTVSVAVPDDGGGGGGDDDGGFTVSELKSVVLPSVAESCTVVVPELGDVVIGNVALVAPAATVTLAGTVAAGRLLVRLTTAPPDSAALDSVTVPVDELPAVTLLGLTLNAESVAAGGGGGAASGVTVNVADLVTPPPVTEIVTTVCVVTCVVNTLKPPAIAPAGTMTLLFT